MSKVITKKTGVWHHLLQFLKPWIAFSGLYATFSVCPFCGQSCCPAGIGGVGVVGGLMALCVQKWGMLFGRKKDCKNRHGSDIHNEIQEGIESMTYNTTEIETGYHPLGYRIDKRTVSLDRYTQWTIDNDGKWIDAKPVCFHSLPVDGWIKGDDIKQETIAEK